jgi:hypothetical protein
MPMLGATAPGAALTWTARRTLLAKRTGGLGYQGAEPLRISHQSHASRTVPANTGCGD